MSNTKKFFVIIVLQIAAIIVMAFVIRSMGTKEVDIGFGEWASEYMAYDGVSYSLKGEYVDSGQGLTLFSQPGLYMPAGSYTMTVSYVSDENQSIALSTPVAKQDRYISAGTVLLPRYIYDVTYDFELRLPVDEVNFDVKYGGSGNFTLNSVTIVQNHNRYVRYLAILAFLMILVDLYFFWFKRLESGKRGTVLALLGIWLLSSLPLFFYGIVHGDDLPFHLARIEALAQELRNGDIPARVGSLWLYGWGYPSSVLYGDYLLYLPALCRILHFNVVISYKVLALFVNLLTVAIAYWSFKYIFEDRNDALLLTLVYSTAAYRLTDLYSREAMGEFNALIFIPLVAAGFYGVYRASARKTEGLCGFLPSVLLGCGMAGIVCSHVLSTEMVVITLFVAALLLFRSTFNFGVIKRFLLSILIFVVVSASFLVPFVDYYRLPLLVKAPYQKKYLYGIQRFSVKLAELFSPFRSLTIRETADNASVRYNFTPGLVLLFVLGVGIYLWVKKKATKEMRVLTALSLIMLFLSTDLFPWDFLTYYCKPFLILAQVQFAYRYVGMALVPLTMLLGFILKEYDLCSWIKTVLPTKKHFTACVTIVSVLMVLYYVSIYGEGRDAVYIYDTAEMNMADATDGSEYLLENSDRTNVYGYYRTEGLNSFNPVGREDDHFDVEVSVAENGGYVDFPVFNYPHYQAVSDSGDAFEIVNGEENNMIRVLLPATYSGHVYLSFKSPVIWRLAEFVSLLGIIGVIVYFVALLRKRKSC